MPKLLIIEMSVFDEQIYEHTERLCSMYCVTQHSFLGAFSPVRTIALVHLKTQGQVRRRRLTEKASANCLPRPSHWLSFNVSTIHSEFSSSASIAAVLKLPRSELL